MPRRKTPSKRKVQVRKLTKRIAKNPVRSNDKGLMDQGNLHSTRESGVKTVRIINSMPAPSFVEIKEFIGNLQQTVLSGGIVGWVPVFEPVEGPLHAGRIGLSVQMKTLRLRVSGNLTNNSAIRFVMVANNKNASTTTDFSSGSLSMNRVLSRIETSGVDIL